VNLVESPLLTAVRFQFDETSEYRASSRGVFFCLIDILLSLLLLFSFILRSAVQFGVAMTLNVATESPCYNCPSDKPVIVSYVVQRLIETISRSLVAVKPIAIITITGSAFRCGPLGARSTNPCAPNVRRSIGTRQRSILRRSRPHVTSTRLDWGDDL